MNHVALDSFQLLAAIYLFYVAIKGSGTLYNFPEIPKEKQTAVHSRLRKIYALGGLIALLDAAASMLQNSMYTVTYTESGMEITQNYTLDALAFLSYRFLSIFSAVCTILFVLLLAAVFIYIRKQK